MWIIVCIPDTLRANSILEDVEQKNEELRNKTEQSEKFKKIMKVQLDNNIKCQKYQQSEANKMKSAIEEVKLFSQNNIELLTRLLTH